MKYLSQINAFWNWAKLNDLSYSAGYLYFAILDCANTAGWKEEFNAPNSTLMAMTGLARDNFNKSRNVLVQKGLIEYKSGTRGNAGVYRLIPLYDETCGTNQYADSYANPYTNPYANQYASSAQISTQISTPYIDKDKTRVNNNPPTPHTGVMDERFERFWSVYPKKVGKGAAKAAFMKIKPSQDLTDKMVEAVRVASKSIQWQKEKGQYIPNPSTWLNQGRWEDSMEVEPPKPKEAPYPHPPKLTTEEKLEARQMAEGRMRNHLLDDLERKLCAKSIVGT